MQQVWYKWFQVCNRYLHSTSFERGCGSREAQVTTMSSGGLYFHLNPCRAQTSRKKKGKGISGPPTSQCRENPGSSVSSQTREWGKSCTLSRERNTVGNPSLYDTPAGVVRNDDSPWNSLFTFPALHLFCPNFLGQWYIPAHGGGTLQPQSSDQGTEKKLHKQIQVLKKVLSHQVELELSEWRINYLTNKVRVSGAPLFDQKAN